MRNAIKSFAAAVSIIILAATAYAQRPEVIQGDYIVVLNDKGTPAAVARAHGLDRRFTYGHALNGFAATIPAGRLHALQNDPRVQYVEPDLMMHAIEVPSGVDRIDADLSVVANIDGSDDRVDVDIAILDSGIDLDHPDLNVVHGVNFAKGSQDGDDGNGHGTHVAGSAAALDNGSGVVGVAPGARLWAVKVLGNNGSGSISGIVAGIDFVTANANQIEVANMSLGGTGTSASFRAAIENSVAAGVVYVVAAGNSAADVYGKDGVFGTSDDYIPASYPEVAAISASADSDGQGGGTGSNTSYGADDTLATFSNFSKSDAHTLVISSGAAIDLAAPGVDIVSTYKGGGYASMSGTSMASPHVAGLAGLYIAQNGRATDASGVYVIRQALIDSAEPQSDWRGGLATNDPDSNAEPLADAEAATKTDFHDVAVTALRAPAVAELDQDVVVEVDVANQGTYVENTTVTLTDTGGSLNESSAISLGVGETITLSFSWTTTGLEAGEYTLEANAAAVTGEEDVADNALITTVTLQEPVHDVAVSGVNAPSPVAQGDAVTVTVDLANLGTYTETFNVTLTDETEPIGIQAVTLAAGSTASINFMWDTTGVTLGAHTLTAVADIIDDDPNNNSATTGVMVESAPSGVIVQSITHAGSGGKNGDKHLLSTVALVDDVGQAVVGALVSVRLDNTNTGASWTGSATTNSGGTVSFELKNAPQGCYTLAVTGIDAGSLSWDGTYPVVDDWCNN